MLYTYNNTCSCTCTSKTLIGMHKMHLCGSESHLISPLCNLLKFHQENLPESTMEKLSVHYLLCCTFYADFCLLLLPDVNQDKYENLQCMQIHLVKK